MIVLVLAVLVALVAGAAIFAIRFVETGSGAAATERAKKEKT